MDASEPELTPLTATTSPRPAPTKPRVATTYGRRKQAPDATGDATINEAGALKTVKNHADSDDERDDGASGGFQWDWRKRLQMMDQDSDDEDANALSITISKDPAVLASSHSDAPPASSSVAPGEPSDGSDDAPRTPSPPPQKQQDYTDVVNDSPSPFRPRVSRGRTGRMAIYDSDNESDDASTKGSPAHPHFITTPKRRSSPTPPSSDEEFPNILVPKLVKNKGKGKAKASETSFREHSPSPQATAKSRRQRGAKDASLGEADASVPVPRNKKTRKVKPPTKKERREMVKESARLAAGQHAVIPRDSTHTQTYTVKNLFETIKQGRKHNPPKWPLQPWSEQKQLDSEIGQFSSSPTVPSLGKVPLLTDDPIMGDDSIEETPARVSALVTKDPDDRASRVDAELHFQPTGLLGASMQPSGYNEASSSDLAELPPPADDSDDLPDPADLLKVHEAHRKTAAEDSAQSSTKMNVGETEQSRQLREIKMRVLRARQEQTASRRGTNLSMDLDDDDGLEIVPARPNDFRVKIEEQDAVRRSERKPRPSEARKQQTMHAGIALHPGALMVQFKQASGVHIKTEPTVRFKTPVDSDEDEDDGPVNSSPLDRASSSRSRGRPSYTSTSELNKDLLQRAAVQARQEEEKKREEFIRRGGQVVKTLGGRVSGAETPADYSAYIELAEKNAERRTQRQQASDDEEDDADPDWRPDGEGREEEQDTEPDTEAEAEGKMEVEDTSPNASQRDAEGDTTMVASEHDLEEDEDEENVSIRLRAPRWKRAGIVTDDDEPLGKVLVPGSSFVLGTPTGHPAKLALPSPVFSTPRRRTLSFEDDKDKENAASSHRSFGMSTSLSGLGAAFERSLSMSPGSATEFETDENLPRLPVRQLAGQGPRMALRELPVSGDTMDVDVADEDTENVPPPVLRRPFGELHLSPGVGPSRGALRRGTSFLDQLRTASPGNGAQAGDDAAPSQTQFGDLLQPGFAGLFDSSTQDDPFLDSANPFSRKQPFGELTPSLQDSGGLGKLRQNRSLDLTQDMQLQSAFRRGERTQRRADELLQKEQELAIEAAAASRRPGQQAELYINDHGFLTQTRPDDGDVEMYRPPTPTQALIPTQGGTPAISTQIAALLAQTPASMTRIPLGTLSFTEQSSTLSSDDFDGMRSPLRRLRRQRSVSPTPVHPRSGQSPAEPPSKRPRNAYDVLGKQLTPLKPLRLEKSEFVEEEAQESDEERDFFGGPKLKNGDDEAPETEELDGTLTELVDDQKMTEEQIAEEKVVEKFQEHQKEDDAVLQKLHEAATRGEIRKRSKRGLLGDDSDDDVDYEMDENNRMARLRMVNSRLATRGDIQQLRHNTENERFFQVYGADLTPEVDPSIESLVKGELVGFKDDNESEAEEKEDGEDEEPQIEVSPEQIRREVLEAAKRGVIEDTPIMDPNDVSYVDASDDDDDGRVVNVTVKTAQKRVLRAVPRDGLEPEAETGFSMTRTIESEATRQRLGAWADKEQKWQPKYVGRGPSGKTSVVTSRDKAKNGEGSHRGGQSVSNAPRRPVPKTRVKSSLMAAVDQAHIGRFT
ncbi:hypothetical protein FISHEDRAFT_76138 [Fistulina hepatica ATCC 64428]|uniref:DNA replication checkpoint mediator MRC1 domain-containing protein n=1 Tax=Fistulina hepatica ATCC 64428 TaxID=1128425 RepID=A0A0D7A6B2_9AGAR|nr:hypothetical protein FISHEDRAFT_76138 [Fistulina hepatica ATCC 64428]